MNSATYQAYGHTQRIFDVRFAPSNGLEVVFASGSDDTTVRVWKLDTSSGQVRQTSCCFGHTAEVTRVAWSPDGRLLASGSADGTVRIWEPQHASSSYDGHQVALLEGHPEEIYHCEFMQAGDVGSVDNQSVASPMSSPLLLLVASSESLYVWDVESRRLLQKADAPGTLGSSLKPEEVMARGQPAAYIFGCSRQPACAGGRLIATACADAKLRFWALGVDGRLSFLHEVELKAGGGSRTILTSCAFDPLGMWLACTARDGTVFILDVRTMSVVRTLRVPDVTFCCSFAQRDGREWLVLPGSKGHLTMFDIQNPVSLPVTISTGCGFDGPLLVVSEAPGGCLIAAAGEAQLMAPIAPAVATTRQTSAGSPSPHVGSPDKGVNRTLGSVAGAAEGVLEPGKGVNASDDVGLQSTSASSPKGDGGDTADGSVVVIPGTKRTEAAVKVAAMVSVAARRKGRRDRSGAGAYEDGAGAEGVNDGVSEALGDLGLFGSGPEVGMKPTKEEEPLIKNPACRLDPPLVTPGPEEWGHAMRAPIFLWRLS